MLPLEQFDQTVIHITLVVLSLRYWQWGGIFSSSLALLFFGIVSYIIGMLLCPEQPSAGALSLSNEQSL